MRLTAGRGPLPGVHHLNASGGCRACLSQLSSHRFGFGITPNMLPPARLMRSSSLQTRWMSAANSSGEPETCSSGGPGRPPSTVITRCSGRRKAHPPPPRRGGRSGHMCVQIRHDVKANRADGKNSSSSLAMAIKICLRQAKPGKGGRDIEERDERKPFIVTRRVQVPNRKGLAIHRNRVLRGAGATATAKRTQGVCRPCDGASKEIDVEPTLYRWRKATTRAS